MIYKFYKLEKFVGVTPKADFHVNGRQQNNQNNI